MDLRLFGRLTAVFVFIGLVTGCNSPGATPGEDPSVVDPAVDPDGKADSDFPASSDVTKGNLTLGNVVGDTMLPLQVHHWHASLDAGTTYNVIATPAGGISLVLRVRGPDGEKLIYQLGQKDIGNSAVFTAKVSGDHDISVGLPPSESIDLKSGIYSILLNKI